MLKDVKAAIFDLDGTLIDSMWIWRQVDIEYLAKRGIELPEDLQKEIEGMSFTDTALYFKKRFSLSESVEVIKAEWTEMSCRFYNSEIQLKKGVKDFLQRLYSIKMPMGIATSNSRELAEAILKRHNIINYFSTIRTACEVSKSKPFPDVYLKAAKDLGVEPKHCIAFEDTLAGAQAAKSAGMKVIAVADNMSILSRQALMDICEAYIYGFDEMSHFFIETR